MFFTHPIFFIDIRVKNKTVICHLSLLCIIPCALFIIMSIMVYFLKTQSHGVTEFLFISLYLLIT